MPFELFDPTGDLRIHVGNLPHWYQPGVTYFVTFRTEDSLPADIAELWHRRRRDWLARHGISIDDSGWKKRLAALPDAGCSEFHRTFSAEFLAHLDRGHGECVLRRSGLARIVAESLWHFDGQRYEALLAGVPPGTVRQVVAVCVTPDPAMRPAADRVAFWLREAAAGR